MNQSIELTLDAIAHGGEAIGRHGGKTVFVPYAIPGERVRVEIVEEKERWARTRLLEVVQSSPDRVEPPCPYFGPDRCGGCQWQHIAYERQAELKAEIVADHLRRLGRIATPPVVDTVVLAAPPTPDGEADPADRQSSIRNPKSEISLLDFGYRSHVRFDLTTDGRLGFRQADGAVVIPIDRCLLLHERLDELHAALDVAWPELTAVSLRAGINTDQGMILMETPGVDLPELELDVTAACAVLTPRGLQPLIGEPWMEEEVAGRRYRVSAESSFPANTVGAEALVEIVRSYADLQPTDVLLDAGCGVGLFALALAASARRGGRDRVIAIRVRGFRAERRRSDERQPARRRGGRGAASSRGGGPTRRCRHHSAAAHRRRRSGHRGVGRPASAPHRLRRVRSGHPGARQHPPRRGRLSAGRGAAGGHRAADGAV